MLNSIRCPAGYNFPSCNSGVRFVTPLIPQARTTKTCNSDAVYCRLIVQSTSTCTSAKHGSFKFGQPQIRYSEPRNKQ